MLATFGLDAAEEHPETLAIAGLAKGMKHACTSRVEILEVLTLEQDVTSELFEMLGQECGVVDRERADQRCARPASSQRTESFRRNVLTSGMRSSPRSFPHSPGGS